jgi:hypothetical protein
LAHERYLQGASPVATGEQKRAALDQYFSDLAALYGKGAAPVLQQALRPEE